MPHHRPLAPRCSCRQELPYCTTIPLWQPPAAQLPSLRKSALGTRQEGMPVEVGLIVLPSRRLLIGRPPLQSANGKLVVGEGVQRVTLLLLFPLLLLPLLGLLPLLLLLPPPFPSLSLRPLLLLHRRGGSSLPDPHHPHGTRHLPGGGQGETTEHLQSVLIPVGSAHFDMSLCCTSCLKGRRWLGRTCCQTWSRRNGHSVHAPPETSHTYICSQGGMIMNVYTFFMNMYDV